MENNEKIENNSEEELLPEELTKENEGKPSRKSIIYVDDVAFSLISVKNDLSMWYEVYTAQTVSKMFDILRQYNNSKSKNIDLILLDLNMPDIGGFDALKKLKSDPKFADIPVVFLSAKKDKESVKKGTELGAAGHMGKPFSISGIRNEIERVLTPETIEQAQPAESAEQAEPAE
jgi:putative two-component system response regulator